MDDKNIKAEQDDLIWFEALNGKTKDNKKNRLRTILREIELADAAAEDISNDWQRLQLALRHEEDQKIKTNRNGLHHFEHKMNKEITVKVKVMQPVNVPGAHEIDFPEIMLLGMRAPNHNAEVTLQSEDSGYLLVICNNCGAIGYLERTNKASVYVKCSACGEIGSV
jgi:ribosomal protein S27E